MIVLTRIYKIGRKFGASSPKNWQPKTAKFGPTFGKLGNSIANISGIKQDIVEPKTDCKLQSLLLI